MGELITSNTPPDFFLLRGFPLEVLKTHQSSGEALTTAFESDSEQDDDDLFSNDGVTLGLTVEELRKLLKTTAGADVYESWLNVGFALHHETNGSDDGLALWHEWSVNADNYDSEVLESKWPSLDSKDRVGRPITARYILKLAKSTSSVKSDKESKTGELVLNLASDIEPVAIQWVWPGWLPAGKLVLSAGAPGTGKTTLAISFASTASKGGNWPDGTRAKKGKVVIWSGEDDARDTLVPRLIAMGADTKNVLFVGGIKQGKSRRAFDPASDSERLLKTLVELGNVALIIIDPIVSAVAGDSHKNAEVRRGLQPIVDVAEELGAVLIGITHFTKGTSGRDTTERVTGSLAFAALARVVLATARDSKRGGYVLTRAKSNLGPDGGGFRYALDQVPIYEGSDIEANSVTWGEVLQGTSAEIIREAEVGAQGPEYSPDEQWLLAFLRSGPKSSHDVKVAAKDKDISEDRLNRAKKSLKIKPKKSGFNGGWSWALPSLAGFTFEDNDDWPTDNQLDDRRKDDL